MLIVVMGMYSPFKLCLQKSSRKLILFIVGSVVESHLKMGDSFTGQIVTHYSNCNRSMVELPTFPHWCNMWTQMTSCEISRISAALYANLYVSIEILNF